MLRLWLQLLKFLAILQGPSGILLGRGHVEMAQPFIFIPTTWIYMDIDG
jgi:hypothetical protein